ncbi:hypothetical protein caldi_14590 [Caldinitratiruptor microaerophilus]|uniref:Glycosyl transferase family 1 domain-containing protein n=1 Tax=Caldinitratiruptor microaerophilus TaxID=671077 RepID=A0AA35CKT9_9FIRM|nr:hypothetical protein caldi_14590 [Caldinitratiruptor microaerophilus]
MCIAPSRELAALSRHVFPDVPSVYIPNGTDVEAFTRKVSKDAAKRALGLDRAHRVVLAPRRLEPKNGIEFLIRAIPLIQTSPKPLFCIVGTGSELQRLQQLASSLGVSEHIIFMGSRSRESMPLVYAAADVVTIPSLIEATSVAAIEALAAGAPIVASDIGGLRDLLAGESAALLVPPANAGALAAAIDTVLTNDDMRHVMATAGPRLALRYSWNAIAEATERAYEWARDQSGAG